MAGKNTKPQKVKAVDPKTIKKLFNEVRKMKKELKQMRNRNNASASKCLLKTEKIKNT